MFHESPEFIKHLDRWLDMSEQPDAKFLNSNKTKIPQMFRQYTKPLYRGLVLNQVELTKYQKTGQLTLPKHTSWSKDKKIAIKFVDDPQYKISAGGSIKLILTKSFTPANIILDINSLFLFYGQTKMIQLGIDDMSADSAMKEQEVLITSGIKIIPSETELWF